MRAKNAILMVGALALCFPLSASLLACGGGAAESGGATSAAEVPVGPRLAILQLNHPEEVVVLRLDLSTLRSSPRYPQLEEDLATASGLSQGTIAAAEAMIHRADEAVGVLFPGTGGDGAPEEGVIFANGRFSPDDFQSLLRMAATEGGGAPQPIQGPADRALYAIGDATIARFTDQTWAIGHGARARELLGSVSPSGRQSRAFEIGPRVGLPAGSMQAWADQNSEAGVEAFRLVMAGDRPEMVHELVRLVRRRIGADPPLADAGGEGDAADEAE